VVVFVGLSLVLLVAISAVGGAVVGLVLVTGVKQS
jgi:hypothetical protein